MPPFKSQSRNLPQTHLTYFCVICPTRWTVRAASLQSVLDNYEVLLSVSTESQEGHLDSDIRARVTGVEAQMLTFA